MTPTETDPQKVCPRCSKVCPVHVAVCDNCNHQFRTQFGPEPERTQLVPRLRLPAQPPIPPEYHPPSALPPAAWPPPPAYMSPPVQLNPPPGMIQKVPGTHSVAGAILLSILLMGTGQMLNGQVGKGVLILCVGFAGAFLGLISLGLLAFPVWIAWLVALIDAICVGNKINQGRAVGVWEFF